MAQVTMKRKITLLHAVSLIVGSIIGSGIFVTPGGVLHYSTTPGSALLIWALCGVICTIGALCFSELGTMLPETGGDYTYILYAFGDLPAFLVLWVNVLVIRPAAQAVVALAFAEYALALAYPGCQAPKPALALLASLALATLTGINCKSVSFAMRIQTVFTSAKLVALIAIIIAGLAQLKYGSMSRFAALSSDRQTVGGISLALYSGLFTYGGWNYVNFVTEELKDPQRNLPRSIWIALPLVTCIYVLANLSYLIVLSPAEVTSSEAVAVLFGQRALGPLQYAVPVFVALSTFGSLNGILFTSGRLFLAGARQGHLPPVLSFITIGAKTPTPALVFTCLLSLSMVSFDIISLINSLSFALWLTIGGATAALLWLRRVQPNLLRPNKIPLPLAIIFLACCVFLVVLPVITEPESTGLGALITLSGIPFYYICVKWKKPKKLKSLYYSLEVAIQKGLIVMPAEYGGSQVHSFEPLQLEEKDEDT